MDNYITTKQVLKPLTHKTNTIPAEYLSGVISIQDNVPLQDKAIFCNIPKKSEDVSNSTGIDYNMVTFVNLSYLPKELRDNVRQVIFGTS